MTRWKNAKETVTIAPTLQMLIDSDLDQRIETIEIDVVTSGYNDPGRIAADPDDSWSPEFDVEIEKVAHAVAYHSDGNIFDMSNEETDKICDNQDMIAAIIDQIIV